MPLTPVQIAVSEQKPQTGNHTGRGDWSGLQFCKRDCTKQESRDKQPSEIWCPIARRPPRCNQCPTADRQQRAWYVFAAISDKTPDVWKRVYRQQWHDEHAGDARFEEM